MGLYYFPLIRAEYHKKVGPVIPVEKNDVFFALHAATITAVTIAQCFAYERGCSYKVSFTNYPVKEVRSKPLPE